MIVYVLDPGVFGIVLSRHPTGCMVKWYLDGIQFTLFLEKDEYIEFDMEGGLND